MSIVYSLRGVASPALDRLMLFVTQLGSEYVYVTLLVVAFVAVDAKRSRSLALTLLASLYLSQVLKTVFATQRPFHIDPEVAPADAVATAPGNLVFASYTCPAGREDEERETVRDILTTLRLASPVG